VDNIFGLDMLFFPLRIQQSHWILMMVDFKSRVIWCLDLLGKDQQKTSPDYARYFKAIFRYIQQEYSELQEPGGSTNKFPSPGEWTFACPRQIPRQKDGYNCGVYVCMYIYCISTRRRFFDSNGWPSHFCRIMLATFNRKAAVLPMAS